MTLKQRYYLGKTWRIGIGILFYAFLVMCIVLAVRGCKNRYGRNIWDDRDLSADVEVHAYNNDRVRLWNRQTRRHTTPRLDWVSGMPERDSLTVFCDKRGRRGFLNANTGKIVIPAQYAKAWHFSEGIAAVMGANGKIGFIDHDNRTILGFEIPYESGYDYLFKDGYCEVPITNTETYVTNYTFYDKTGKRVLPLGYTSVSGPDKEGYRVAENAEGDWLFDRHFRLVFPEAYDDIRLAVGNEGVYLTRDHHKQLVTYDGKVIEPFVIDETCSLSYAIKMDENGDEEYALETEIAVYRVGRWDGLLDLRTGKPITPARFWSIDMVSKNFFKASLGFGSESVLLDRRGNIVETDL